MSTTLNEALAAIRRLVEQAKGGPMSSNVKVSRTALLSLVEQAEQAASAAVVAATSSEVETILAEARAEAERVVAQAREEAAGLVRESDIVHGAEAEAEALRLESQTWVDNHLAEFETGLQRTLEQVETLRDRLAARSRDDDDTL